MTVAIAIDGSPLDVEEGTMILDAAAAHGTYIPSLCSHPDLPPLRDLPLTSSVFQGEVEYPDEPIAGNDSQLLEGCGLCVVTIDGRAGPSRHVKGIVQPASSAPSTWAAKSCRSAIWG